MFYTTLRGRSQTMFYTTLKGRSQTMFYTTLRRRSQPMFYTTLRGSSQTIFVFNVVGLFYSLIGQLFLCNCFFFMIQDWQSEFNMIWVPPHLWKFKAIHNWPYEFNDWPSEFFVIHGIDPPPSPQTPQNHFLQAYVNMKYIIHKWV